MMKFILEAEEGLKADLVRVFSTACLPFMLYYLYLNIQYSSYIEDPTLISPLSYVDYILSHTPDFKIMAFTVLIGSAGVLFGPILARMRLYFKFGNQINKLTGKLSRAQEDTSLQVLFIQRFKHMSKIISETMEHVVQSAESIPREAQQSLIQAAAGLAKELSKGLCANLQKETLNVGKTIKQTQNHFTDYMQSHHIKVQITCPEDLTVVADPLFTRLVFLNILGFPLCSTQTNGEISVLVTQNNGYAHVEVQDKRQALTTEGKQYLKFPREFLAENDTLRQLCFQNEWSYEFKEQEKGKFYTKVSIPLEDYSRH